MSDFAINSKLYKEEVGLVEVTGFLDAHTFDKLEAEIDDLFEKEIYKIIVDMEKVPYISSAGAGVFIWALGQATENGGNVVILKPTENVTSVLELLGLTQIFTISQDMNSALAEFN